MSIGRGIFISSEGPAELGLDAQHIEIVAGDHKAPDPAILTRVTEVDRRKSIGQQTREHIIVITKVAVIGIGESRKITATGTAVVQGIELLRMVDGQWL